MRLAVTGAAGMLGQAVVAVAREAGHDVRALDRATLDITDAPAVERTLDALAPEAVVNCAAWTDVDGAESAEAPATAINGDGAGNVARAATRVGARLIHVSTDYVFDGTKRDEPYVESDPVAPIAAYGRSKLAGERQVAGAGGRYAIVRTAWVFGAGGRNFVDTILRAATERDELQVVDDQIGCPTWTGHLAQALVELAGRSETGLIHVAGGGRCSWFDLAVEALRVAGIPTPVARTSSDALDRPAPRPAWSVLASERPGSPVLPPWQEGVAAHVARRAATPAR